MPDPKPLAEAARRLKAGELPPAQLARAHRDALRENRRRDSLAAERIKLAQARLERDLDNVAFWAAHESMLHQRPAPVDQPVPEEPRGVNVFARESTHGYGTPYRARYREGC